MVKVWDLRGQLCIQTMSRFQSLGPAPISGLFFNEHNRTIVIAASQVCVHAWSSLLLLDSGYVLMLANK